MMERRLFSFRFHRPPEDLAPVMARADGAQEDDAGIVDRIVAAYPRLCAASADVGDSMWREFFATHHTEIHRALLDGQRDGVERILRDPASSDLFYGFDSLAKSLLAPGNVRREDLVQPAQALDGLVRLAEAVGARRLDNPEAYAFRRKRPTSNADDAIAALEATFGFQIEVPNLYRGECGVRTKRGIVSFRVPQALYQAWRMSRLVAHVPRPRVLEIGGGLGRTAFYANAFGLTDYTIVDIPISSVAQAYFLGRTLGNDGLQLFGETKSDPSARIKLVPPASFLDGSDRYDLIVNADSLTELDESAARAYWAEIESRAGVFLSINHEANRFTVKELIASGTARMRSTRAPYWMRRGYVEETVWFERAAETSRG